MPKTNPECPSNKQHVSISQYALSVIRNDALTFYGKTNDSGIICTIIQRFMDSPLNSSEYINKEYPKEEILKIRLRERVRDYLYISDVWQCGNNRLNQGDFIRLIVEHYARQPFFNRERVIYWERVKSISEIVESAALISINTHETQYIFKPYRFSNIYESGYNYLIGMSKKANETDYKESSFRLSRLSHYNRLPDIEELSTDDITQIEKAIRQKGVEFLVGDLEIFKVLLTPEGKNMYDTTFHLRPMPIGKSESEGENVILTFRCTERQICNYFFKFGNKAIVISPHNLRKKIQYDYNAAYLTYAKEK